MYNLKFYSIQMIFHNILHTSIGNINILARDRCIIGVFFESETHFNFLKALSPTGVTEKNKFIEEVGEQIHSYLRGEGRSFDIPYGFEYGNELDKQIWGFLGNIPYGKTATYKQVAHGVGRPNAVRAVANAIGRNPISIILPCHRVIGSDGKLRGYAGGVDVKEKLLTIEGRL